MHGTQHLECDSFLVDRVHGLRCLHRPFRPHKRRCQIGLQTRFREVTLDLRLVRTAAEPSPFLDRAFKVAPAGLHVFAANRRDAQSGVGQSNARRVANRAPAVERRREIRLGLHHRAPGQLDLRQVVTRRSDAEGVTDSLADRQRFRMRL